jgi:hypothetical protein
MDQNRDGIIDVEDLKGIYSSLGKWKGFGGVSPLRSSKMADGWPCPPCCSCLERRFFSFVVVALPSLL